MTVTITVLGPPVVMVGETGQLSLLHSRLLGLLVGVRPSIVHSETLANWLWRGQPPRTASSALRLHVSRLRKALEDPQAIETIPGRGYRFRGARLDLDCDVFVDLIVEADQFRLNGDHDRAIERYVDADRLWRGRPFEGCDDHESALAEQVRLDQLRQAATDARLGCMLATGAARRAIPELRAAMAARPGDETIAAMLMKGLSSLGFTSGALAVYDGVEQWLHDEHGIGPSVSLRRTADRIAARDTIWTGPNAGGDRNGDTSLGIGSAVGVSV